MQAHALTSDEIERHLQDGEAVIAKVRSAQMVLIREADRRQIPLGDGCRSIDEWLVGRMDVAPETASTLARTTRLTRHFPHLGEALSDGRLTWDRAVAVAPLVVDVDPALEEWAGLDVAGIRRQVAMRRRLSRHDERRVFADRYLSIQPSLDESLWRLHGQLPGFAGRVVEKALVERADDLSDVPGERPTRSQRNADALWAIAQDSLDGACGETSGEGSVPLAIVFVDATHAAPTRAESGVVIESGSRVGPDTLEMILCSGAVEVTAITNDAEPIAVGSAQRAIPPRLRRHILHRDGGSCTAEGCQSRYRLQPHHIVPYTRRPRHDAANLTTLCWFHHHVVVHGRGYRIDPGSPRGRIRFNPPDRPRDPP